MIAALLAQWRRRQANRQLHERGIHSARCPRMCGIGNDIRSFNRGRDEIDRLRQKGTRT
jgi:hypothetical protein